MQYQYFLDINKLLWPTFYTPKAESEAQHLTYLNARLIPKKKIINGSTRHESFFDAIRMRKIIRIFMGRLSGREYVIYGAGTHKFILKGVMAWFKEDLVIYDCLCRTIFCRCDKVCDRCTLNDLFASARRSIPATIDYFIIIEEQYSWWWNYRNNNHIPLSYAASHSQTTCLVVSSASLQYIMIIDYPVAH